MNYFYEATDTNGKTVMGRLEAVDEAEVRTRLLQSGYRPQAIAAVSAAAPGQALSAPINPITTTASQSLAMSSAPAVARQTGRTGGVVLAGNAARLVAGNGSMTQRSAPPGQPAVPAADVSKLGGVNDRDRLFFFQQFASLVKSGISLYSALDNLGPRTKNRSLSKVAAEMAEAVRKGGIASDVMARYPRIFEENIVGLVRAGELGGFIEIALSEIAHNYEQNIALYRGAWIARMMATQALFALVLAIPAAFDLLGNISLDTGIGPGLVQYLIHEAILLPLAIATIFGVKLCWNRLQSPSLRRFRDGLTLRMPPFGDLHRQAALAAFIRMLRRLFHAGIGPAQAWEGAMNTASNLVIRERLAASYDMMQRGASLPDAFAATGLFNNNIEQLIMTGHVSGEVVESLDQVAEYYQEQIDEAAKRSRLGIFRVGCLVMLVIGGAATLWLVKSFYAAIFHFVDKNFSTDSLFPIRYLLNIRHSIR